MPVCNLEKGMLGIPACSWQQAKLRDRNHEACCDGDKDGGEHEHTLSSCLLLS